MSLHAQTALSPWVQEVLNRVDAGIGVANGIPNGTPCDNATAISEIQNNVSMVREGETEVVKLESEAESLRSKTVCYEYDRRLLQEKKKQLLNELDAAVENCKLGTSRMLRDVYAFLNASYVSFLFGGTNPAYKDDRLKYTYPFEDMNLTEPIYDSGSTMPVCAFTTDYGPHAIGYVPTSPGSAAVIGSSSFDVKSYGCDQSVLGLIQAPLDQEASKVRDFMTQTDDFSRRLYDTVSAALLNINAFMSQLYGGTSPPIPGSQPPPPHEAVTGCLKPLPPDPSTDPVSFEDLLRTFPEYFDPDKGNKDPATGMISYGPEPGQVLPIGVLFQPATDYFRAMPASSVIMRSYLDRRTDGGLSRPLPVAFVNQILDAFVSVTNRKVDSSEALQFIDANMEQELAFYDAISRDAADGMAEAAKPLKDAVDSLVETVSEFLPKEYIPNLTFFMARSCVDGHCQQTLDAVAKRLFNPYCLPYVSGDYMEDDTAKRCFCDPSIQASWSEYDTYCNPDYSPDMSRYNGLPPDFVPGCMLQSSSSSSSSVTP